MAKILQKQQGVCLVQNKFELPSEELGETEFLANSYVCDHCDSNHICSNIKMGLTLLDRTHPQVKDSRGSEMAFFPNNDSQHKLDSMNWNRQSLEAKLSFYGWNFPFSHERCALHRSPTALEHIVSQLIEICQKAHSQQTQKTTATSNMQSQNHDDETVNLYREEVSYE